MIQKVKILDELDAPALLDHLGWRLWQASQLWQGQFKSRMVAAGHPWFGEARAALIPCVARSGTRQQELALRLGLTKQAIQQLVDLLVEDGLVERRSDPNDARGRLVCFTRKGLRVLADANRVKLQIEDEYGRLLGAAELSKLKSALATVVSAFAEGSMSGVLIAGTETDADAASLRRS